MCHLASSGSLSSSSSDSSSSVSEKESDENLVPSNSSSDKESNQCKQEGMGQPRMYEGNEFDDEMDWFEVMDEIILNPYPKVEGHMVEDLAYWYHEYYIVVNCCH